MLLLGRALVASKAVHIIREAAQDLERRHKSLIVCDRFSFI